MGTEGSASSSGPRNSGSGLREGKPHLGLKTKRCVRYGGAMLIQVILNWIQDVSVSHHKDTGKVWISS